MTRPREGHDSLTCICTWVFFLRETYLWYVTRTRVMSMSHELHITKWMRRVAHVCEKTYIFIHITPHTCATRLIHFVICSSWLIVVRDVICMKMYVFSHTDTSHPHVCPTCYVCSCTDVSHTHVCQVSCHVKLRKVFDTSTRVTCSMSLIQVLCDISVRAKSVCNTSHSFDWLFSHTQICHTCMWCQPFDKHV